MFDTNEPGKGFTLKRNPNWDPATDPNRKALPDGYSVKLNVNADDIDNQLISRRRSTSTSPAPACSRPRCRAVLSDPTLKAQADNPSARGSGTPRSTADGGAVRQHRLPQGRRVRGGPHRLPDGLRRPARRWRHRDQPAAAGRSRATRSSTCTRPAPTTRVTSTKAKAALTACGKPNGFKTNMAYRAERPEGEGDRRVAAAALGQGRHQADPEAATRRRTTSRSTSASRTTAVANDIGLATNGWGADWNDGFGFLSQIVDSRVIRATGGSSNLSVRIPAVDALLDQAMAETDVDQAQRRSGARSTRPSWTRP